MPTVKHTQQLPLWFWCESDSK